MHIINIVAKSGNAGHMCMCMSVSVFITERERED